MRTAVLAAAAAAALPLTATAIAARPAHKAAAVQDWSRIVAATPEGGFRMGNPAARVKLVEYGSLACPHCRHFEETGFDPLVQRYVRTGQVSYEFRNLLISGIDIPISLLTRCAGPAKFFAMSKFVYDTQPEWEKKFQDLSSSENAELDKLTDQQRILRFAEIGDMTQIAARFGITPAQARQCLTDPHALQQLLEMRTKADDVGIHRTPTFIINGKVSDASTWDELEPQLKQAIGG